jgi:hypothetical protein
LTTSHWNATQPTSIVDQSIEPLVFRDDGLDHRIAALLFPDVERVSNVAFAAEILDLFLRLLKGF